VTRRLFTFVGLCTILNGLLLNALEEDQGTQVIDHRWDGNIRACSAISFEPISFIFIPEI